MNTALPGLSGPLAVLEYLDGDYDVIDQGTHVVCATTGEQILLDDLRYWSVSRQEAYADAGAALRAYEKAKENGDSF